MTSDTVATIGTEAPPIAAPGGPNRRRRVLASAGRAAPAVGLYLGLRMISALSFLQILRAHGEHPFRELFTEWDATLYRTVAEHGYSGQISGGPYTESAHGGNYAFFPLYPGLMRALAILPGLTSLRAGIVISFLASVATVWGLYEIGRFWRDARTGFVLAGLWAVVPDAVMEGLVYADQLFIAIAVWTLYAVARRRWLTGGVLCLVAGVTRSTSFVLVAAVLAAALVAALRHQDGRRPLIGAVMAPLGALTYVLYVSAKLGSLTGYFKMQHDNWNNHIDWGSTTRTGLALVLGVQGDGLSIDFAIATLMILTVPVLLYEQVRARQPLAWIVFCIGTALITLLSMRFYATTTRELMPTLPFLLLPVASVLARTRRSTLLCALAIQAVAAAWYAWYVPVFTGFAP